MSTVEITRSKVAHWQEYSACIEDQKISRFIFYDLDEPHLQQIINILYKRSQLLELVTKIKFDLCIFGKSANEKITKLIKPSLKSLIFKRTRFIDDGAVICSKLLKISSLEEVSFLQVDLRRAYKALCKLILKGSVMINLSMDNKILGKEYCEKLFETMKICSNLKSLELNNLQYALNNMFVAIAANTSLSKLEISADDYPYNLQDLNNANPKTNLVELQLRDFHWQDIRISNFIKDIGHYYNLTKLVVNNCFYGPSADQLAGSLKHLTNLKSLDITSIALSEPLINAIAAQTSIVDLTCTRATVASVMAKCQSVKSSVNFKSMTIMSSYYDGIGTLDYNDLRPIMPTLTKLQLYEVDSFDMSKFIEGLNSVNGKLTELDITKSLEEDTAIQLAVGLEKNTKLRKLSLGHNTLSDLALESICKLIRVNRHIQSLSIIENLKVKLGPFKKILEVLKVNKTLLYLEIPVAERDIAVDLVANECSKSNSTLLFFEPFSMDYRVDMWLQRNKQLRVTLGVLLANIMKNGSMLPLEIWLRIFGYLSDMSNSSV